jgi:hypothetical protein
MENIVKIIGTGLSLIVLTVAGWFGYQESNLGATIPISIAVFETTLSSAITTTDTSMTLVTGTDKSGDSLNGYMCFTLDGGKTNEEFVCGTASSTAVSGLLRGLDPVDAATSTALAKTHRAGSNVKITDWPALGIISRILNGQESFPNKIYYATDTISITNRYDIPTKAYVDAVATSGAANSDYTTAGLVELATTSEIVAGTALGATGAYLVAPNDLFNQTSTATNIIPVTNSSGKLSQGFLDLTEAYTWTGLHTFSTATTTIATATISYLTNVQIASAAATTSANLKVSSDAVASTTATSGLPVKVKEIQTYLPGTVRVYFEIKASDTGHNMFPAVYVNGTQCPSGCSWTVTGSTSYASYDVSISANAGDRIQLYAYGFDASYYPIVQNFRLYYTEISTSTRGVANL